MYVDEDNNNDYDNDRHDNGEDEDMGQHIHPHNEDEIVNGNGKENENENADVKREEDDHTRTGDYDNERTRDARRGTATLSDNDVERTTQNTNYEKRTPRTLTPTTTELPRSSPCHDFLQWYLTFRIRSQCDKRMFYRMWITTGSNEEHAVLSWSVFGSSNLIF